MRPDALAVIGLGAIGGSLAWQARLAGVPEVIGYSPRLDECEAALRAGALTAAAPSPEHAAAGATLVVIAAPPAATLELVDRLGRYLPPGALLTDVASVKSAVVARAVQAGLADRFVGGHPLTGTHVTGWAAARPDRFGGCTVYLTPTGGSDAPSVRAIAGFWREVLEARPVTIGAEAHDRQLAWTSHLPQAVAYAVAAALASRGLSPDAFGPGARDATRLAASDPDLWVDIFLQNREAVLAALDATASELAGVRAAMATGDAARLRALLAPGHAFRQGLDG